MRDARSISTTPREVALQIIEDFQRREAIRKRQVKQNCLQCHTSFTLTRSWQKYCSPVCKQLASTEALTQTRDQLEHRILELERQLEEAHQFIKSQQQEIERLR